MFKKKSFLIALFISMALAGQGLILFISGEQDFKKMEYRGNNDTDGIKKIWEKKGVIDSINHINNFLVMRYPSRYILGKTAKIRIYFDNNTVVRKIHEFQENGIVYFQSGSFPSSINEVRKEDKVLVALLKKEQRFYASNIIHDAPFPATELLKETKP
ncbi:hypothetical protein IIA95_04005 [Patescibacteria group bacterium]|nr:hypothetical protein [Patescibacteria group bacterium]